MKPREERKREARILVMWTIGAVGALLFLYVVIEGAPRSGSGGLGPLLGAGVGASLTYMLSRRQRREEDAQRRRTLATTLLNELRFLEGSLRNIRSMSAPHLLRIAPPATTVYDTAGANLLLFDADTVDALNTFYLQIKHVLAMLQPGRREAIKAGSLDEKILHSQATLLAYRVQHVASRLRAEGGVWPAPVAVYPPLALPDLPPAVFADYRNPSVGMITTSGEPVELTFTPPDAR